jgi:enoyl-CoA hydratase/carnithine racemase
MQSEGDFPTGEGIVYLKLRKENLKNGTLVYIVTMCNKDNRFNPSSIRAWNQVLDLIEKEMPQNRKSVLITTNSNDKIYSNGLDLEYLFGSKDDTFITQQFLPFLHRFLVFRLPTVACISGNKAYIPLLRTCICRRMFISPSA